jgi:serine/threonine protein phosphatase PrpC
MDARICTNCGALNRSQARYCNKCGNPMVGTEEVVDEDSTRSTLRLQSTVRAPAPTYLAASLISPKAEGESIKGYSIQEIVPLQRSNYYIVRQERCPNGHVNAGTRSTKCNICQAELGIFLMRESQKTHSLVEDQIRGQLVQLNELKLAGLLAHFSIFEQDGRNYTVCEYPGDGWKSFNQVILPVKENALIVNWCLNLGEALLALSYYGLFPDFNSIADYLELTITRGKSTACFADLTGFKKVEPPEGKGGDELGGTYRQKMVSYLAQILYTLTSGKRQNFRRAPRDFSDVPAPFRVLIGHASRDEFETFGDFLKALANLFDVPTTKRSLRQIAGYRTESGKRRTRNEDFIGKYNLGMQQSPESPEIGLYLVADGMGGHQSGDLASREVVQVIVDEIQSQSLKMQLAPKQPEVTAQIENATTPGEVLKKAIERANEVLYNARQQRGSDRGTTLTAALIVGEACAIANVGDSRTYFSRGGSFDQITKDHSLVASLVDAQMIAPDEVRAHPQRSHIYRNLGDRFSVQIDVYELDLKAGDRLLLCSDGLWEMVLDEEIQQMLQGSSDPQEACDRMVNAANLAGGEDNISVVTVWLA